MQSGKISAIVPEILTRKNICRNAASYIMCFFKKTIDKHRKIWYHTNVATVLLYLVRFVIKIRIFVNRG